ADVNVNAPAEQAPAMAPPTRTDDQILPHSRWVPVGKSNCYLDVEKSQINLIYKIAMDILKHTNFFRAFTASSTISLIYIQQFWDTIRYDRDTARYIYQLDEQCHRGHSLRSLTYVSWERLQGLKDQELRCYRFSGASSIEPILIMQRGCRKNSPNPSIPSSKTKESGTAYSGKEESQSLCDFKLVDESVDEGIPEKEPRFDDEEADIQRAVEKSLKSVHDAPRGRLPQVVIKEPDFGKFQPLLEVQGKEKKKVTNVHVALDLLTLQTPKKVSPVEQYIFQRRTPASTEPSSHAESPSIYAELGFTDSDSEFNKEVPPEAGSNPGDDADPQPQSSLVIHAGPNLEHMDLEATNVSIQQNPDLMDEGFTTTTYPNVQENLKLTVKEQVILEEPASCSGTLSTLQHLAKDFSFGYLFFNDKPSKEDNKKITTETKAESMVSVIIQQDTSAIPLMTTPVGKAVDEIVTDAVHWAIQAPLHNRFRDLPEADMKEILHQRMWETNSYKAHKDHMRLYEAPKNSINRDHTYELQKDLAEAQRKKKKRHDSPKTPPGSPPH
nr:hypothetical protein [Tanacetum cinerariifolium]